jgi:hypothetical protein
VSQKALLVAVTNNLRAVTVSILPQELILNFYYENAPSEQEIILCEKVFKKVCSDFYDIFVKIQTIVLSQPIPIPIKKRDQWVYHRYEGNPFFFKIKTFFKDVSIAYLRCASQFALLGSVTNNLRAVSIAIQGKDLILNFYYSKSLENNLDSIYQANLAEMAYYDVILRFAGVGGTLNRFIIPETENILLQNGAIWVYKRYEKIFLDT